MKSTRERILLKLLSHPKSTINELADSVGINAISVRHHLTNLQADGLVTAEEERHGVGRPRLVYFLTEQGNETFPTHYLRLTNRLLDYLKKSLPEDKLNDIFSEMGRQIVEEHGIKKSSTLEEKLNTLVDVMADEGFSIEWEKNADQYLIHEISCPYFHITRNHNEICAFDQTLISSILSIAPEKVNCVMNGDSHCSFTIKNTVKQG